VGCATGVSVGSAVVGESVSADSGDLVGCSEGAKVLGLAVGWSVGGAEVGAAEGPTVGAMVVGP
jgi:hypothetical protein